MLQYVVAQDLFDCTAILHRVLASLDHDGDDVASSTMYRSLSMV